MLMCTKRHLILHFSILQGNCNFVQSALEFPPKLQSILELLLSDDRRIMKQKLESSR